METTLALIKPDAMKNQRVYMEILGVMAARFIIADLVIARWNLALAAEFYDEHRDRPFFKDLIEFTASGPIAAVTLVQGDAVATWRSMIGSTDPAKAERGTVRWTYGYRATVDPHGPVMWNAVHGSDSVESAQREIKILRLGFAEYPSMGFGELAESYVP